MNPQGRAGIKEGHEGKDADVLGVTMIIALVLLLLAIGFLAARGVFHYAERRSGPAPKAMKLADFPAPRLEAHPVNDYQVFLKSSEKELHTYGWVDRKAGVVRMPIERAMQLTVQRGLPEAGGGQTQVQLMQARPATDTQPRNPVGPPSL